MSTVKGICLRCTGDVAEFVMKSVKKVYRIFRYLILGRKFKGINAKNHALPNFIIIGAMKSGTTSLYNYICERCHL